MLKAILYSEFDNVTGPKLVYQHPPCFLSDAVFDSISDYLITTQELCGSIIRVRASDRQVLSYPLRIEDDKYDRNALLFNVAFAFDADADVAPFNPVLRKLGQQLLVLERERGFLLTSSSRGRLPTIMRRILVGLNESGECAVDADYLSDAAGGAFTLHRGDGLESWRGE